MQRIVEKPATPPSSWAVTGLYVYDDAAPRLVRDLVPSARGELEITDLNGAYLRGGMLQYYCLGHGTAWLDTGTPDALLEASHYVQTIQNRHGVMLGCPEEAAWRQGWISDAELGYRAKALPNEYGQYLARLLRRKTTPTSAIAF